MNKINFAIFFALIFAVIGFAGAELTVSPSIINASGVSGQASFTPLLINNTYASENLTNISLSFPNLTSGALSIPSSAFQSVSLFNLSNGSSSTQTIALNIPSNQAAGLYTGVLTVSGYSTTSLVSANVNVQLNITQSPQLILQKLRDLTSAQTALISIQNSGNSEISSITLANVSSADFTIAYNNSNLPFTLSPGQIKYVEVSSSNLNGLVLGDDNSLTIKAVSPAINSSTIDLSVPLAFCRNGTVGNLDVNSIDITNDGDGDENDWNTLDPITIEVEVENQGTKSISNVYVEIKIIDSDGNDVTDDFDFDDNKLSIGKINDDDTETATFNLPAVPTDVDDGDYTLYVKAYKSGSEDSECDSGSAFTFSVNKEFDRAVIVRDADLDQLTLDCGASNAVSFDIYNVGDNREKDILVLFYNRELNIQQSQVVSDLKSGGKAEVTFNVNIPSNANKTSYLFTIETFFDYDSGDIYDSASYDQNSADDLDKTFILPIKTTCQASQNIAISPQLTSDAVVGKDLIIEVTVTNTGALGSFILTPSNYDSWASLVSIDPQSFNLAQGASKKILVTLSPKEEGTHTFNIDVRSVVTGQTFTQQAQVSVNKNPSIFAGLFELGSLGLFLVIAILLLVILIVVVLIVKAATRKRIE
jgi:uncharacterized membrane protein